MNDKIEDLLRQMSLAKPSDSMDQRVTESIGPAVPATAPRVLGTFTWVWATAALFVGFALGMVVPRGQAERPVDNGIASSALSGAAATPVTSAASLNASRVRLVDQGVFLLNGQQPVRTFRAITQHRIEATDPKTGEPVLIEVPMQKLIIAPSTGA